VIGRLSVNATSNTRPNALVYAAPIVVLALFFVLDLAGSVTWTVGDFIVVAVLMFGAALAFDLLTRIVDRKYRLAIAVTMLAVVAFAWVELAVGLVGSPFAGS
jgi:hypothetical protein